jgi:hypothetical protein
MGKDYGWKVGGDKGYLPFSKSVFNLRLGQRFRFVRFVRIQ